jgi:hypothetical protein
MTPRCDSPSLFVLFLFLPEVLHPDPTAGRGERSESAIPQKIRNLEISVLRHIATSTLPRPVEIAGFALLCSLHLPSLEAGSIELRVEYHTRVLM